MTTTQWPRGLITALVTPLKDDRIDVSALSALLDRQIAAGVGAVLVCGGTGEFAALSKDERMELATATSNFLAGRLPYIVQTGALATRDMLALSIHAQESGAAGILVASPYAETINWRERMNYFEQLTSSVDLPIMIYDTQLGGFLSLAQIEQLASLPNISAIKESSYDATHLGDLLAWSKDAGFHVYVGADSLITVGVANGAHGGLLGTGNVIPEELCAVIRLCQEGALSEELWKKLRSFLRYMETTTNYVAACKQGLKLSGIDVGDVRLPYLMPTTSETEILGEQLRGIHEAFEGTVSAVS